jgi:hypothetical protein
MKTLIATATLTIMFLSAGAFAGNDTRTAPVAKSQITNVTVIAKNGQWPVKGQISFDACSLRRCLDA